MTIKMQKFLFVLTYLNQFSHSINHLHVGIWHIHMLQTHVMHKHPHTRRNRTLIYFVFYLLKSIYHKYYQLVERYMLNVFKLTFTNNIQQFPWSCDYLLNNLFMYLLVPTENVYVKHVKQIYCIVKSRKLYFKCFLKSQ